MKKLAVEEMLSSDLSTAGSALKPFFAGMGWRNVGRGELHVYEHF